MHSFYLIKFLVVLVPLMAAAFAFRPKLFPAASERKLAFAWIGSTALAFTFLPGALLMLLIGAFIFWALPRTGVDRTPYLVLLVFVIPASMEWLVPFPGINYLFVVNSKILVLGIAGLAALAMPSGADQFKPKNNAIKNIFMVFFLMTLVFGVRSPTSFTNELRELITDYIEVGLLFIFVSRGLSYAKSSQRFIQFFVLACSFIAAVGLFSAVKNWDFYGHLLQSKFGFASRGGSARIGVQFVETLLGVLMCAFAYTMFVYRKRIGLVYASGWSIVAIFVLLATDSRAAILAVILTGGVHFVLSKKTAGAQWLWGGLGLVSAIAGMMVISNIGFENIDEYGTFDYRSRLIETSIQKVRMSPFFGDPNYSTHPMFEPLRQGQGIIDFVNVYVQIVLEYGLTGLLIFLAIPAFAISKVMGRVNALVLLEEERSLEYARYGRWLCVLLTVHMATMATASAVSYIFEYFIVLCAACQGFLWMVERHMAESVEEHATVPDATPSPAPFQQPRPVVANEDSPVFDPFGQRV